MAITYGSYTHSSATNTLYYIKIPLNDSNYDYQLSVSVKTLGNVGSGNGYTVPNHSSPELSGSGWTYKGGVNGALFYTISDPQYTLGLEVVNWSPWYSGESQAVYDGLTTLRMWGANSLDFSGTQNHSDPSGGGAKYALTPGGCFIKNGADYNGATMSISVDSRSGRTFVARSSSYAYLISTAGVTGSTGIATYTNFRAAVRALDSGITDAVVMDGGGSVAMRQGSTDVISSSRAVKTAILVYEKAKSVDPGGSTEIPLGNPISNAYTKVGGVVKIIPNIKTLVSGSLKDVTQVYQKINGSLKKVYQAAIYNTDFPRGISGSVSSTSATSSLSSLPNSTPDKVYDGNASWQFEYGWVSNTTGLQNHNTTLNGYFKITSYSIYGGRQDHDLWPICYPTAWTLQGSVDGSTYYNLDSKSGQNTNLTWVTTSISSTNYYKYLRIAFTANAGGDRYFVSEIKYTGYFIPA